MRRRKETRQVSLLKRIHNSEKTKKLIRDAPTDGKRMAIRESAQQKRLWNCAWTAADDSGEIRVEELGRKDGTPCRILKHASGTNEAMVTCAAFRPHVSTKKKRYIELASGGTDCSVNIWDIDRPRFVVHPESKKII